MSPIDDELRSLLHSRAAEVAPAPDPLDGIASRARGLRRRRATTAAAGAAAVVVALAVGVPLLVQGDDATSLRQPVATPVATPVTTESAPPSPAARAATPPANLVTWLARGDTTQRPPLGDVLHAVASASGHSDDSGAHYHPLYDGSVSGVHYTLGQAWYDGDAEAHTFGYMTGGSQGPHSFYGPVTPSSPQLLALLVDSIPGSSTDLLVLVPRPGTGQLLYATSLGAAYTPVASGRSDLNGIGLVDRATSARTDQVEQLDGDGNMDQPLYKGPVAPLLCGDKECG